MVNTDILFTLLRIVIGALFIGHGTQKLFGWFAGAGMQHHTENVAAMGFRPANLWAWISALAESLGGLTLVLGFLTPIGAAAIFVAMIVGIFKVHWRSGLWNSNRGYEFNLIVAVNALILGLVGPGAYALDHTLSMVWSPPLVFGVSALIGIIAVIIGLEWRPQHRQQTPSPQSS